MIVRDNLFLMGVSGRAKNMVVKQYKDKTVITGRPNMSDRVLTEKQIAANEKMKQAISYAKAVVADPRKKERACQRLGVPPNEVFRAIVKQWLLNDQVDPLEESEQEKKDRETLVTLKSIIVTKIPDAEVMLFGNRAKGTYNAGNDWDILILTDEEYPKAVKWELQEKLFNATIKTGTRVNIILAQKNEWLTNNDYELLRKKIGTDTLAF